MPDDTGPRKIIRIVVLDGYTLNPGDLSWDPLRSIGRCDIHDRTSDGSVVSKVTGASIVLTNKVKLGGEHFKQLPDLKYIGILATGTNVVELSLARQRGICVTNVSGYATQSVAQATLALLLELTNHVGLHAETVRDGKWTRNADWCYWERPLIELNGLTMGIIGFGKIGRAVAALVLAFGMRVVVHSRSLKPPNGSLDFVSLEEVLAQSDVISLHCPITEETHNLINAQRLTLMKPSAFLLNTSRGPLIDEQALAHALNAGRLAGAGLDVLSVEPPPETNPLLNARNCLITPHLAWASHSARARLLQTSIKNVEAFLAGRPENVVN